MKLLLSSSSLAGRACAMRYRYISGFTLIELITVMVIMGVLAAVGVARLIDNTTFDARGYADQVKTIVRYAQKTAIAQGRSVYLVADANHFSICTQSVCDAAHLVSAPAGSNSGSAATKTQCKIAGSYISTWMCEGMPSTVAVAIPAGRSADVGPGGAFFFDSAGRPNESTDSVGSSTFSQLVLTFSGGATSYAVTIEAETGYVH